MSIEDRQPTPSETRNKAWSGQGPGFWNYEEGKRDRLPPEFESFYQANRSKFKKVLDVGCGTGKFLIPMLQDGLQVVGIEPSEGMRKGAEDNLRAAGLEGQARIIEGDSTHLDFPDASVDMVFSKGAIHHNTWEGIQRSFREVARVLKPKGTFIFQGRSIKDSGLARSERVEDFGATAKETSGWKKGVTQHYFTEEELRQLAAENGFEIVLGPEERVRNTDNPQKQHARWWVVYRKIT